MLIHFFRLFIIASLIFSCKTSVEKKKNTLSQSELKEPLIEINRQKASNEALLIDKYIERRKWDMVRTGTGLHYMIYDENKSEIKAENGQIAEVSYKISLLDGKVCYKTEAGESRSFLIGQDNVESGIHEGITYMSEGDKAVFIIPSHLAHGLTGDLNKIPPQSTLVVDLHLIALSK